MKPEALPPFLFGTDIVLRYEKSIQIRFSEKRQVCTYQVDLFRQRGDGAWDRDFEEHRERAWSREELEQFLTEAGFRDIVFTGDLTDCPPEPEEDRWIVRAVRPAEEPCI